MKESTLNERVHALAPNVRTVFGSGIDVNVQRVPCILYSASE